jgi:hypothetical protein
MSARDEQEASMRVANEFAAVDVTLRHVHNGVVLEVANPQSGERVWLDALEIEALARLTPADRRRLVDPSRGVTDSGPIEYTDGEMVGW